MTQKFWISVLIFFFAFGISAGFESTKEHLTRKWIRPRPRRYILGGVEAPANKFPFLVFLRIPDPDHKDQESICGGAIIEHSAIKPTPYKILTAAHCFDDLIESKNPGVKDMVITLTMGVNNVVTQISKAKIVKVKYSVVKIQPDYDEETNADDLAIIPLPADFKLVPGSIETIAVAPVSDQDRNYAGVKVEVAGWGVTGPNGQESNQLLYVTSTILADDPCEAAIPSDSPAIYNKNFLCIDGTGNKGTCHGDSGGPLIDLNTKVVVGISSFRLTPRCEGPLPTFFIRVVKYLYWIHSTI